LANIEDADLRKEFYRIQEAFARIIQHDVCTKGGIFYYGNPPVNREIEARLEGQGDLRPFMTKEGVLSFPAAKTDA